MKRFAQIFIGGIAISIGIATGILFFAAKYEWDSVISDVAGLVQFFSIIGALVSGLVATTVYIHEADDRAGKEAQRAKKEAERVRQEAEATALAQKHLESIAAEQRSLLTNVGGFIADAKKRASELPKLAQAAERAIDKAEEEFADGVFAPFWDAVEVTTTKLAEFEFIVQQVVQRSQDYNNARAKLLGPAPAFDFGLKVLPDATHASNRLKAIVRQAQKNPHFATIYELRKTNRILVEGFTNLGQALTEVGDRLESSMDTLRSSLTEGFAEAASASRRASAELVAELEQTREQSAKDSREAREMSSKDSEARRKHEREEREMLDNIQRRKKPRN